MKVVELNCKYPGTKLPVEFCEVQTTMNVELRGMFGHTYVIEWVKSDQLIILNSIQLL